MHPIIKAADAIASSKTIPQLRTALRYSDRAFHAVQDSPMIAEYQEIIKELTRIVYNQIKRGKNES